MATYLQGVTDYIPDYQPFQPDLNFYNNVLQTKQTQYDTNWKAVNNLYAELHNSDLTHDQNVKKKDDLLKQIDFNLKRVTGLDLSLEQNVDQATQVFRPFYEDKYLMKDMAWTKNYNGTLSRALNLQNSQDEKMQKQFWGTGIKEMQFRKQEFKDATLDQTLNMGNVTYTPYVDALEKYRKLAKDSGISIDIKDVDETGMYFIHEKNGKRLTTTMQNLFLSAYANDPALQARYGTEAYVKRKEYAEQQATKFNGNKTEAEKEYLRDQYTFLQNYTAKKNSEAQEAVDVNTNKTKSSEIDKENNEANPFTESYIESLNKALAIDQTVANHSAKLNDTFNANNNREASDNGANQSALDLNNLELARIKVDSGTASLLAEQHILMAADNAAMVDYKYEKTVNPIGLENLNHKHSLERISYNHALRQQDIKLKAAEDRETERIKKGLEDGTMWYDQNGQIQENDGSAHAITLGPTSGQFGDEINVQSRNASLYDETVSNLTGTYIGSNLLRLKQLADRGKISNKEAWDAVSWLDPNSKEANTRYGTTNGKELIYKLWNKYQTNSDKFILDFTKTNQVVKLKKFMDNWTSKNIGSDIATAYNSDKSQLDIQKYIIYRDQSAVIQKKNNEKITKNLTVAMENTGLKSLSPEDKDQLANLYLKYKDKDNGDELFTNAAQKLVAQKNKFRPLNFNARAGLDASMIAGLTTAEKRQLQNLGAPKSGDVTSMPAAAKKYLYNIYGYNPNTKKKVGAGTSEFKNIFDQFTDAYVKTLHQTGADGLDSYEGIVATKGGRYALGSKDVTAKDVYLNKPGWGGFTAFQQGMADINRIRFNQDSSKYAVTYGGLSKLAAKDQALDPAEMKAMLREMQMSGGTKSKIPGFKIARSPVALENPNLRALIIVPPQSILEKYIKITEGKDAGKVDWAKIRQIKMNGISFIAPKSSWTSDFINDNELTPTEQILNASGEMKYQHGNGAGEFTITKVKNVPGVDYATSYKGHWINEDGTIKTISKYTPFQRSGNKVDATQTEMFDLIQKINEHNLEQFKIFQQTGNKQAIANVHANYKQPSWSGFKY
jgi:hypothetical protein